MKRLSAIVLAMLVCPALVNGQRLEERFPADTSREPSRLAIRVGKWTSALAAAGAVGAGIVWNRDADRRYEDLERLCSAQPARCNPRTVEGAFRDAELEGQYQEVLRLDDRARVALIAGQVALATSVLLFILDLPREVSAPDKPYTPPKLQLAPQGSRVELRFRLR